MILLSPGIIPLRADPPAIVPVSGSEYFVSCANIPPVSSCREMVHTRFSKMELLLIHYRFYAPSRDSCPPDARSIMAEGGEIEVPP